MTENQIILVSHGNLAAVMLETVEMLMGPQRGLAAYGLTRDMAEDTLTQELRDQLLRHGQEHILFISDIEYGTPCNVLMLLTKEFPGLHHMTGMNLAAIVGALTARDGRAEGSGDELSMEEIGAEALVCARKGLQNVRDLLEKMQEDTEEDLE